ncbi:hypothetical protein CFC21_108164 [Triticum aestivum]|uniref:NADH:flavin oxidoreductase/NADH oxidase N-terminal domain-containing protein n=2 Tax=Triticum aestivum TaxID=4565 RepID=A0A9R1MHR3_WHEAT|nr:hypothetical protein CFC21_006994 [Triticum aestivum]KAF7107552.1 hypothetical protein CFC21_108164 [Triticum aestivum]
MGRFELSHRVVLAPLTRCRSYGNVPQPHAALHYSQRATKSGLLIAEATSVSATAQGFPDTPGIWTQQQSSSRMGMRRSPAPTIIYRLMLSPARSTRSLDGFIQMRYGGSLENRCRFAVEVIDAIVHEIGADRVGIRLSPFTDYMDCFDSNPHVLDTYMVQQLNKHKEFLYCHMVEPHMTIVDGRMQIPHVLLPFRKAFNDTFIAAGGYDREEGNKVVIDGYTDLIAYGRLFLANLDFPKRFELDVPLNKYDRSMFYMQDPIIGYTDYPFLDDSNTE